jgi:hypothetical protein
MTTRRHCGEPRFLSPELQLDRLERGRRGEAMSPPLAGLDREGLRQRACGHNLSGL